MLYLSFLVHLLDKPNLLSLITKSIVYNLITENYITYEKKGLPNNKKAVNFFNIMEWDNFKYTKYLFSKIITTI